jgi:hypothetical protein
MAKRMTNVKPDRLAFVASDTSLVERLSPDEMAERVRAELLERPVTVGDVFQATVEPVGADEIAVRAKMDLSRITGLDADRVSAVKAESDGWHVTVDLIELRRIPPATDVLAAYEAIFAPAGTLVSFQRMKRYLRDQMMEQDT